MNCLKQLVSFNSRLNLARLVSMLWWRWCGAERRDPPGFIQPPALQPATASRSFLPQFVYSWLYFARLVSMLWWRWCGAERRDPPGFIQPPALLPITASQSFLPQVCFYDVVQLEPGWWIGYGPAWIRSPGSGYLLGLLIRIQEQGQN